MEISSCGLLFFRRTSILGLLGSINTYGILILGIKDPNHIDLKKNTGRIINAIYKKLFFVI